MKLEIFKTNDAAQGTGPVPVQIAKSGKAGPEAAVAAPPGLLRQQLSPPSTP